jgi:transposase-like protein
MDITSFVGKLLEEDDVDLLREGVRILAQALMETEVSSQIGAGPYERSSTEPPRGRIMSALGREWNAAAERGSS